MRTLAAWQRAEDSARPLRGQLLRLVAVLAGVVMAAGAVLGLTVRDLRRAQDYAQGSLLPAAADAQRLLSLFVNQETGQRGFVITGDEDFLQPYQAATAALPGVIADLRRHATRVRGARSGIDAALSAHRAWLSGTAMPEIAAASAGDLSRARDLVSRGKGKRLFDVLRSRTDDVQRLLNRAQTRSTGVVSSLTTRLTWLLVLALTLLTLLLSLLYPALRLLVVDPLQRFAVVARRAGQDLSAPVVVSGPREVVTAAREVEGMRRRLVGEIDTARHAVEALGQRGPAVVALRDALSPRLVPVPELEVVSRLDPAEGFLAGDWVDAFRLDDGRLGLVLGDVAGHGPGPAVFALRLKYLLAAALTAGSTPGEALTFTARQIGDTGELFATVFVAILDVSGGQLTYANAGHPAAVLVPRLAQSAPAGQPGTSATRVSQGDVVLRRVELAETGPLLSSLVATWSWGTLTQSFGPGDLLFAYTDGLVEARSAAGEQYGGDRLMALLASAPDESLDELVAQLLADVAAHTGGPASDDTTVVACRRHA